MVMEAPAKQVLRYGFIADLRRSRKYHRCDVCKGLICPNDMYYTIVIGGGGLGSLCRPDRVHVSHLVKYLEDMKKSWEGAESE